MRVNADAAMRLAACADPMAWFLRNDFEQASRIAGEETMRRVSRAFLACAALLVAACIVPAGAAEKLRVGKAVAFAWTFTPLDVGMQTGIFAKHGVEIEASAFNGDARMQQGLTSD